MMARAPEPEAEHPPAGVGQHSQREAAVRVSDEAVSAKTPEAGVNLEQIPARIATPYKKRYKVVVPKSNLDRRYHAARVVPAGAVTHEVPARGEYSRDHGNRKQDADIAIAKGPTTRSRR